MPLMFVKLKVVATAVQVLIGDLNPSNYIEYDILNKPSGKLT